MNQLVPEQISEIFTPLSTHHLYQTRSAVNGNLYMPTSHLFTEQRSLSYAGSKLWNEMKGEGAPWATVTEIYLPPPFRDKLSFVNSRKV